MRPQVDITLMNGGLGLIGPPAFGTVAILAATPVAPVAGYGVAFLVKNTTQLKTALAQVGNEAVLDAILNGFYKEAAEGTNVYIMCMARTTTLATMLAATNADKVLTLANGAVRMLGVIKFPDMGTYVPVVTTGFDADVHAAVIAAQTLADRWFVMKKPFRVMIEGFAFSNASAALDYSTNSKRNVAIVVGSIDSSTAKLTMQLLGKASKQSPEQNIGRVLSGSLNIAENAVVKIGSVVIENVPVSDLEVLNSSRYMSIERNEVAAGYIVTDDNMLTALTDDYNSLVSGRVIDNAVRVTFNTYYKQLKNDVEVNEGGRLDTVVEKALENAIEADIDRFMRPQISKKKDGTADAECLVNPDATAYAPLYAANGITDPNFNILQTGQVYLFLQLRPKGMIKHLNIFLGFTV